MPGGLQTIEDIRPSNSIGAPSKGMGAGGEGISLYRTTRHTTSAHSGCRVRRSKGKSADRLRRCWLGTGAQNLGQHD